MAEVSNQAAQCLHILCIVPRLVDWHLGDEGAVAEALVVEQAAKGLESDGTLADLLMPIQLRSAGSLRIVRVPDADIRKADGVLDQTLRSLRIPRD